MNRFFIFFLTFSTIALFADSSCDPCCEFYRKCPLNSNLPYAQFDFLYWKAQNKGFIAGTFLKNVNVDNTHLETNPIRVTPEWDLGYRASIGWNLPCDCLDVSINYTYFHTNLKNDVNTTNTNTEGIAAYWTLTDEFAQSVIIKWKLNENLIDALLEKSFLIGRTLFSRPFLGFRWGWLNQDFKNDFFSNVIGSGYPSFFFASQKFSGGGPILGIKSNWALTKNLSFIGNISSSFLYGNMKIKQDLTEASNSQTPEPVLSYKDFDKELSPNVNVQVGISLGSCFCKNKSIEISAMWEVNYWWNQYQLALIQPNSGIFDDIFNKPLTQHGITIQARIDL